MPTKRWWQRSLYRQRPSTREERGSPNYNYNLVHDHSACQTS